MALTDRVLPPSEWSRLSGMDLSTVVDRLDPESTTIVVVEDGDQIIGCWALVTMLHAEGVWIDPAYRGRVSVARRLWRGMRACVRLRGRRAVITGANQPVIHMILKRATPLPQEYLLCL